MIRHTAITPAMIAAVILFFVIDGAPLLSAQEVRSSDDIDGTLTLVETVQRVLQSDPGIQRSDNRTLQARQRYNLALSATRPRAEFDFRPYTYDQRTGATAGAPGEGDTLVTSETTTHGLGGALQVTQPLPTRGALSVGIDHTVQRVVPEDDDDGWRQQPEMNLSFRQPLFTGGQLVGTRVYRAGLREAEIGYEQASLQHRATTSDAIREVVDLYVQTGNLRRSVALLEETIAVLRQQLETAELDRQQGLISDTALLALQVTLNNRREALFSTRLQLVQVEQLLARSIGIDAIEEIQLEEVHPNLAVPRIQDLHSAVRENARIQVGMLAVEQAEQRALVNDAEDRPELSVFAQARPVYPDPRPQFVAESFTDSFSELFASDASVTVTAGVSLRIPLLTARQREYRERIDELTRRNAMLELNDTEQMLANQIRILLTNRRFLEERLELLDVDVDYEQRRVENERTLQEAGVSTELRVREVELDLRSRRNERSRVRAELFLNSLDLLNALGEQLSEVLNADG